ncbi:hypothetical protein Z517_07508 [Fonsecaea pedrosoi CBS 271.37]|uniref:Peptidase M12B domain-containing protein n=1 Tax=Fonsecaea pedrosoi CBS 271.37 TaxID=1442368 RepID=A0A0D2DJ41_9EURO|nr:uncharacterized protein Z517_07508 [Fonsecaea pedrosoi CBS 271.37]KIW77676.1 hypothetical protein Z517_07508 [Fonsecaea pedrosoi CBS 271.37]
MRLLQNLATGVASCLLLLFASTADAHSRSRNPLNYLSLIENPRIQTPSQRVHCTSSFDLTFDLHQSTEHVRLSLEPNNDIIHEDSYIEYIDKYGNIRHVEKMQREEHKIYQGKAFLVNDDGVNRHVGWARIAIRRDGVKPLFEGAFTVMGNHHNVQLKSNYMATKHELDPELEEDEDEYMAVWRDSDVSRQSHTELRRSAGLTCASDKLEFNTHPDHPIYRDLMLKRDDGFWGDMGAMSIANMFEKRQSNIDGGGVGSGNSAGVNLASTIGSTAGCPTTRKVALVGVATDCTYTASFNSTDTLRQNVISLVNTASELYQSTFNITLGLRNLTVSDGECPGTPSTQTAWNVGCSSSTDITQRLNLFSSWRGQRGDDNAYWSLFTTCNTGAEVGLAWLGQLCNHGSTSQQDTSGNSQSVTGANVIAKTSSEWQVFAHESGHTFGAVHDCDSSTCGDSNVVNSGQCCPLSSSTCDANAQYMMNPFSSPDITATSAEMVLLRKVKTVIVVAPNLVLGTAAATPQLANSIQAQFATPATRAVVRRLASSLLLGLSAELALVNVILPRHALAPMEHALQTPPHPTGLTVAVGLNVPVASARVETSSARLSWVATRATMTPMLATAKPAV